METSVKQPYIFIKKFAALSDPFFDFEQAVLQLHKCVIALQIRITFGFGEKFSQGLRKPGIGAGLLLNRRRPLAGAPSLEDKPEAFVFYGHIASTCLEEARQFVISLFQ